MLLPHKLASKKNHSPAFSSDFPLQSHHHANWPSSPTIPIWNLLVSATLCNSSWHGTHGLFCIWCCSYHGHLPRKLGFALTSQPPPNVNDSLQLLNSFLMIDPGQEKHGLCPWEVICQTKASICILSFTEDVAY